MYFAGRSTCIGAFGRIWMGTAGCSYPDPALSYELCAQGVDCRLGHICEAKGVSFELDNDKTVMLSAANHASCLLIFVVMRRPRCGYDWTKQGSVRGTGRFEFLCGKLGWDPIDFHDVAC